MEVGRLIMAAGFFGFAGLAFCNFTTEPQALSIRDASLYPKGDGLAVTATIMNEGPPVLLTGIGSDSAGRAVFAGAAQAEIALPGNSVPQLALDGAHGMLRDVHGAIKE